MRKDEKTTDEEQQRTDEKKQADEKKRRTDEISKATLEYGAKGFNVIPVCCGQPRKGKPDYKLPFLVGGHGAKDGTTDPAKIREWFAGSVPKNIGITCQNLLVLDVDVFDSKTGKEKKGEKQFQLLIEKLGSLPPGPVAQTGTGGKHYFFKRPDAAITGRAAILSRGSITADNGEQVEIEIDSEVETLDVDIRIGNEYVVAPPSVNQNGTPYIWLNEPTTWDDLPELPPAWIDFLPKKDSPRRTAAPVPLDLSVPPWIDEIDTELKKRLAQSYVDKIEPDVDGSGGGTTFKVATAIFWGFDLSKEDGWPIFKSFTDRCQTPWTDEGELEHKYNDVFEKPPQYQRGWLLNKYCNNTNDPVYKSVSDMIARLQAENARTIEDEDGQPTEGGALPAKGLNGIEWVDGLADSEAENKLKFPVEYFPEIFREYCEAVARVVAVDVSFPAYALLSGAAHATAYRATYSYRHYDKERLFFHSMLVAHSGAGKSPVWDFMLFPLSEEEERVRTDNQKELSKWRALSKREKEKAPRPKLIQSPIVHKPTIEKIEQALSSIWECSSGLDELKQGIFLPYDEGAYLLQAMNAYKGNGAKSDESALIPMLDGQGGGSDRVGTDANGLPTDRYFADCHVTIYATVQNDILKSITKNKPQFFQQGFLQRFAFSVPDFVPKKPLAETEEFDRTLKKEYRDRFNRLFEVGGNLTLTREAEKIYLEYEARKTADYNARGELGETRSSFDEVCLSLDRKGMKQVLEVAALLNVLDAAADMEPTGTDARQITARQMEGAIEIMEFREKNFQRLYKMVSAEERGRTLKQRVEQAIEENGSAGLSLRSLTRKFFQREKAETVKEFMVELMKDNPKIKKVKGQKGGETYIIHP